MVFHIVQMKALTELNIHILRVNTKDYNFFYFFMRTKQIMNILCLRTFICTQTVPAPVMHFQCLYITVSLGLNMTQLLQEVHFKQV
jgi:hypothetical protein